MTPHFQKWSFGPKIESVDGICHQTDSINRFYLDVKAGPKIIALYPILENVIVFSLLLCWAEEGKNKEAQAQSQDKAKTKQMRGILLLTYP